MNLILASKSPRRSQLLQDAGLSFEVIIKDVEEIYPPTLDLQEVPAYLAKLKAAAFTPELRAEEVVITADTVVIFEDKILGKPKDKEDAYQTLRILSGQKHEVITGVCLTTKDQQSTFSEKTIVDFYELSERTIQHYIEKFEPFDKAGSYAIQEWIGLIGIKSIEGNYSNVLGLPVSRLLRELEIFGFSADMLVDLQAD